MNSMIKVGNFSSISDVVNTSTIFFLGELAVEKINPNFDWETIIRDIPDDNSAKTKISVALNGYVDTELENLSKVTQKSKSFIVRLTLFRFFEAYNNSNKITKPVINKEELLIPKNELKETIREIVNEIVPEIVDEYLNK